jgi:hypothetical protein
VKSPDPFIVRDAELEDRPRWEPLWRGYQAFGRTIPEEMTEMTWRRFFDGLEPVHALVAEEGEMLIGFVHYLFTVPPLRSAPSAIYRTCSRWRRRVAGVLGGP